MNNEIYIPTKKYVYFNENGDILSVANNNKENGNYVEIDQDEVIDILKGLEQLSNFSVVFDGIEKKYILKNKKIEETITFSIKNNIHEIENNLKNPDITIKQNLKKSCWTIILDNKIKKEMLIKDNSYKTLLHFGVTAKNDPHELYHYFTVNFDDLIKVPHIEIPFKSQKECNVDNTSVYTIKKFQTYSRKLINE